MLMSRAVWPHYLAGTTTILTPKVVLTAHGNVQGTQAFLSLMGPFPSQLLSSCSLCRARPSSPQGCTTPAQAEAVFSQVEPFPGPSPPCAGIWGLLASVPDPSTSQAVALPTSALPPPADFECTGQDTEKERQWVKMKVRSFSEGNPLRGWGLEIKNSRKYSSGFSWELFILIKT